MDRKASTGPEGTNGFRSPFRDGLGVDFTLMRQTFRREGDVTVPVIDFSWLRWQGTEWSVELPTVAERERVARLIWERYAPQADKDVLDGDKWEVAARQGYDHGHPGYHQALGRIEDHRQRASEREWSRDDLTVTPDMVADLLPPEARVRFSPTTVQGREQMLRLGVDVFYRASVTIPAAEVPERARSPLADPRPLDAGPAAPAAPPQPVPTELFRNARFRVLDHGEPGIEVKFRTAGADGATDGSKWFLDAAAEQVREFLRGSKASVGERLERRRGVDEPLLSLPRR